MEFFQCNGSQVGCRAVNDHPLFTSGEVTMINRIKKCHLTPIPRTLSPQRPWYIHSIIPVNNDDNAWI